MKSTSRLLVAGVTLAAGLLTVATTAQVQSAEEISGPKYEVTGLLNGGIEIRRYDPRLVAQVKVEGEERSSLNKGFSILAGYIFGKNKRRDRIEMTAPVLAEPEQIPMTAPVVASNSGNLLTMSFFMPPEYSLETLPEPQDARIQLRLIPEQRYAAIRFSGSWNPKEFERQAERLRDVLQQNKLQIAGSPINAYYNPPFTLPFLRRNEVLLPLAD
jgi:effector-binding domain-containing protein